MNPIQKLLVIVPARAGSKGIPNKNMYPVAGKPLIGYTFDLIKSLPYDYCITTDDKMIIRYAEEIGLEVHFTRPAQLANDSAKMLDVLKHAIFSMEKTRDRRLYEYILLLQPTAPLRSVEDISNAIQLMTDRDTDSVISVTQVDSHHPILMKKIEDGYLVPFYFEEKEGTRRQDYKPYAYMRNGAIYLTTRQNIMKNNSIWGKKIIPYVMDKNSSISIDNMIDVYMLEAYLRNET